VADRRGLRTGFTTGACAAAATRGACLALAGRPQRTVELSLPAGFTSSGLPVAIQLVGAPFGEANVIRAGRAFQHATEWHLAKPPV